MRKNCRQTLDAWVRDEPYGKQGDSIWTDGDTIYSYNTWIVFWWRRPRRTAPIVEEAKAHSPHYRFNATKYSKTTSTHQNAIRTFLENNSPENFSEGRFDMKEMGHPPEWYLEWPCWGDLHCHCSPECSARIEAQESAEFKRKLKFNLAADEVANKILKERKK